MSNITSFELELFSLRKKNLCNKRTEYKSPLLKNQDNQLKRKIKRKHNSYSLIFLPYFTLSNLKINFCKSNKKEI